MGPDNNTKPTILTIEELTLVGVRLYDRAEKIAQFVSSHDLAGDVRLAARVCDKLAALRFRVGEIAEQTLANPERDSAAIARDLRDALNDAEF
jgi:hypothetical protein